jgi:hypothetical protein
MRKTLVSVAALCLLVAASGIAAPPEKGRPQPPALTVGQEAPDFELVKLDAVKDKDADETKFEAKDKIKLSSFRGKKPVFIIFTSYT